MIQSNLPALVAKLYNELVDNEGVLVSLVLETLKLIFMQSFLKTEV